MKNLITLLICFCSFNVLAQDKTIPEIDSVLTEFHQTAAAGDWDRYFALLNSDAIFLGTDASERWTKSEFEQFARKTSGWLYTQRQRHINVTADGNSAWFDELLWNDSYGLCRGSGVLVKTAQGWLITQYNLSIPIPNNLAREITQQIKQQN